jgi:hypothetical protein
MSPSAIAPDTCYADSLGRIRHVKSVGNGRFSYLEFGKTVSGNLTRSEVPDAGLKWFARDAQTIVPCDHPRA